MNLQIRGAEISAARLSEKLIEYGHTILFLGLYESSSESELLVEGLQKEHLKGTKNSWIELKRISQLRKQIQSFDPDIIQANGSDTFKYSVIALIGNNKPKLIYRNISIMSHWLGNRVVLKFAYQTLSRWVDSFVSVGESAQEDLKQIFPKSKARFSVIKRGIPSKEEAKVECREIIQFKYGFSKDDFVLIQLGSLSKEKNIEFSIQLVQELNSNDTPVYLLIVGDGSELNYLKEIVTALAIEKFVKFIPFERDPSKLLAGSDLLILTSLVEGVPGVILEAAIQETPAIAVNIGGVKEVIINRETGILIENHSVSEFIKQISPLIRNRDKLLAMGKRAKKIVKEDYDLEIQSRAFEKLYQELLSRKI
jgi:glycosyltransferase involved in cell wall biosynthesis